MTGAARLARWIAVAIGAAAVIDPAVPFPVHTRAAIRVMGQPGQPAESVSDQLRAAGFTLAGAQQPAAVVLVDNSPLPLFRMGGAPSRSSGGSEPPRLWALDTSPPAPNLRLVDASVPPLRVADHAVEIQVTVEARGLQGTKSEVVLEDAGIAVATTRHEWASPIERWRAVLPYLPPGSAGTRLRVRAVHLPAESTHADNSVEVALPAMRGPVRTLVVEAGVTWPGLFVRRAIEGAAAFSVTARQHAAATIVTRAGAPPAALTRDALAPFEAAILAGVARFTAAETGALRWFVEERGGVLVLIPDRSPAGSYSSLLEDPVLELRATDKPAALGAELQGSELLIARRLPAASRILAATAAGDVVVFSARRGAGSVIFSGALDAWRYRAQDNDAFGRFWQRVIAEETAAVPPALEVALEPSLVSIGSPSRITARLRGSELPSGTDSVVLPRLSARAVSPESGIDIPVRLWPTAEPGVYEGEWRPPSSGAFNISVTAGDRRGDAMLIASATAAAAPAADPGGLDLIARSSGGQVFPVDQSARLVESMTRAFPARRSWLPTHVMRSPWWAVPFAGLLCLEWAARRRNGRS